LLISWWECEPDIAQLFLASDKDWHK